MNGSLGRRRRLRVVLTLLLTLHECQRVSGPPPAGSVDIPRRYLAIYEETGRHYDLDWAYLAGIGAVESQHGRLKLPGVRRGVNCAGAAGPMQFGIGRRSRGKRCGDAGNAWRRYRGDGLPNGKYKDGEVNVYDPEDAIPAAARKLRDGGSPEDWTEALLRYNRSYDYVDLVEDHAAKYRSAS